MGRPKEKLDNETLLRKFWSRVDIGEPNQCWRWKGGYMVSGYGVLQCGRCHAPNSHREYAHRASYRLNVGEIPGGLHILHSCDNPACVNPAHLRVGTPQENARDSAERARMPRGTRHHNAKLTEDKVSEIKARLKVGGSIAALSQTYGVSEWAIDDIRNSKTWRHVA